jgi:putative transcriptional regulator
MSKAGEEILQGMREALAFVNGDASAGKATVVKIPDVDVSTVREKTKLSQEQFAATFGVSLGTLRGWEQGRRRPEGPARVLLTLIDRDPVAVLRTLVGSKAKRPKRSVAHAARPVVAIAKR